MTTPDTKAIRAQMEALAGFTPEPWNADQVRQNARLIAAAPDMRETILALCEALDELRNALDFVRSENERLYRAWTAMHDQKVKKSKDHADYHHKSQLRMHELKAENERLQTIISNLHVVEEKHRETANTHFHRANRLRADNDRLRKAAGVVSAVLQSERARSGGQPFTGNWSIPQIGFRGTVDDALDMADAALAQKGGE